MEQDKIVITKTAATVDAIPASYSVAIEVLEKLGGRSVLDYLVRSICNCGKAKSKTPSQIIVSSAF